MSRSNKFLDKLVILPHDLFMDHVVFYISEDHEDEVGKVEGDLVGEPQVVQHRVDNRISQFKIAFFDELDE